MNKKTIKKLFFTSDTQYPYSWAHVHAIMSTAVFTAYLMTFTDVIRSNATRAPIANPPNSAQLGGIPYYSPVTSGSVQ